MQPTEMGLASPAMQLGDTPEETQNIWQNLPPLYWLMELPELKPGARVLGRASHAARRPTDATCRSSACNTWGRARCSSMPPTKPGAGAIAWATLYFARYWVQTIRYLCRAKLADDRPAGRADGRSPRICPRRVGAVAGAICRRAAGAGRGRRRDGGGRTVGPTDAAPARCTARPQAAASSRALLDRPPPGSYHAWIAAPALEGQTPAADFAVTPPAGEFAQVRMDAAEMRRAAQTDRRPILHLRRRPTGCRKTCRSGRQVPSNRCRRCRCGTSGPCWRCSWSC